MLEIVRSMGALDFEELMAVYRESNAENAQEQDIPIAQVEQNFADYLREDFFRQKGAFYCLWKENGRTVSALRLEPFEDGLLLEALETMPEQRRRGYGKALVLAALDHVRNEYGKPVIPTSGSETALPWPSTPPAASPRCWITQNSLTAASTPAM